MDTNQLSTLLREATDDLEPRAGFTNAVVRGGRRRQVRRRMALATSAAVALTLVTGGVYAIFGDAQPSQVAIQPTQGNLAGDQRFLSRALQAWEVGKVRSPNSIAGIFNDVRSDAYVYWAGTTPSGPAAVVMQKAYLHPYDNLPPKAARTTQTLVGLVGTDVADGQLKLLTDQFRYEPTDPKPGFFQFGENDQTLLAVDWGVPVFESSSTVFVGTDYDRYSSATCCPDLVWDRVPAKDGVVIKHYPLRESFAMFVAIGPQANSVTHVIPTLASQYLGAAATGGTGPLYDGVADGLDWSTDVKRLGKDGGTQVEVQQVFYNEVSAKVNDGESTAATSKWHILVGLPDGDVWILGDNKWGTAPSRICAVHVAPDMTKTVYEDEVVNKSSVLPVRFRLPDRQGWVIANYGHMLMYRISGNDMWYDAGKDAALVPDQAVQVMVDKTIVDLPR